ncbi:MAG: hypothetical protein Kow0056_01130 [Coriobacteriia bacterium]
MKLTPLDIHHKEFRNSLRGYSQEEVDAFLDEVADEFERLLKENIELAEKLEAANEKLREYEQMEKTVHNTLVAAQRSAEEIEANAQKEAELTRKDAELRAKEIIHEALTLKQKTQNEFMRIKDAETKFRQEFRRLLESYLSRLQEIPVPEGMEALGSREERAEDIVAAMDSVKQAEADAEQEVAEVEEPVVAAPAAEPAAAAPAAEPAQPESPATAAPEAPVAPAQESAVPEQVVFDAEAPEPPAAPAQEGSVVDVAAEEPPQSGFVTSVHMGELEDTDLASETPDFEEEPRTFEIPTLDSLGEREDDLDIEEID